MTKLREKANDYAKENALEVLRGALAKVYVDGYKEGCIECVDRTEYIDLGLPSGTLWATDYEKIYGEIIYLRYTEAFLLDIPTIDQWRELKKLCHWEFKGNREESKRHLVCTGPNGNSICFYQNEFQEEDNIESFVPLYFWINDRMSSKTAVFMDCKDDRLNWKFNFKQVKPNKGDKFPLRFVRNK